MKNKFMRSVTAMVVAVTMLISSQGVVTSFADGGDYSDMSESSSVQMNEVSNNGTDQSTEDDATQCTCGAKEGEPHKENCPLYVKPDGGNTNDGDTDNGAGEDADIKSVVDDINALLAAGTITEETDLEVLKTQVNAARAAYNALSEEQKAAFDTATLEKLTALEAKISELESMEANITYIMQAVNTLPEGEPVAMIGTEPYTSLDDAVEKAEEGSTITLLKDCELTEGFNKTLTFNGTGKITIPKQLKSDGEGWMCFGLGDPSRVLTFDGVEVEWISDGTAPWLMLSLSGTLNVTNGAKLTFKFDSRSSGTRNAIYMNEGAELNITNGSTFEILGENTSTMERPGQGIQLDKTGKSTINVSDGSTFLIDGTNRGYVNSPVINVEDSTFTVQNCTSNASNGGNFTATNSKVTYQNNKGHGLSAGDVILKNTDFLSDNNGLYGVYVNGEFLVDKDSTMIVTNNSYDGDCAGVNLTAAVNDGRVEAGAVVTITGNKCSGFSSRGVCTFEEGSKLTITNNINDKGSASYGGGIYNTKSTAHLTLPSDAVIYNNHAVTGGDDIYNTGEITFNGVGSDWILDDTNLPITGWYFDGNNNGATTNRWSKSNYYELFNLFDENGKVTLTGTYALKAAHAYAYDPETPVNPTDWEHSKSKTATNLDANYQSQVTLSLPAAQEQLVSDVVFVLDKSTSATVEDQMIGMLNSLNDQVTETGAKVKVGVVIFNKVANRVLELTELNSDNMSQIEDAIRQEISSGTNTHAGLLAGKAMLDADTSVDANRKYMIFVSDGITYMYNAEPTVTAWSFFSDDPDIYATWAGPDNWNSKHGNNNAPENWVSWLDDIGQKVVAQGTTYEYPYDGTPTNTTPKDKEQQSNYANSIDKALYLTHQIYQEAQNAGYHCYAMNASSNADHPWATSFMNYLAGGKTVSFDDIQNDIYYLLDAGSQVVDVIGEGIDNVGNEYDFKFINNIDNLNLTVGGTVLNKKQIDENTYGFGNVRDGIYDFVLTYYPEGMGTRSMEVAGELFRWDINVPVSNFAPVQLTYTVQLTNPQTADGTYGQYDADGSEEYAGLYTNKMAILYPVDSNGVEGEQEAFQKPTVSYSISNGKPVDPPVDPEDPTPRPGGGGDEDDDTPTIINETPVPTTTIDDEDVPLTDLPEDTVTIDDEEVPLKDIPNTGDMIPVPAMVAAVISIGGIALLMKKHK